MQRVILFLLLVVCSAIVLILILFPSLPQFTLGLLGVGTNDPLTYSGSGDRIIFLGDIMLGRNVERLMERGGRFYPWERIAPFPESALVVGNFEAPVPKVHQPTPDYGYQFSVASSVLPALTAAGVTHVSLANNHSYDHGYTGYTDTLAAFQTEGITAWGDQSPNASTSVTYVSVENVSVALIALNAVSSTPSPEALDQLFAALMATDRIVVFIHWGTEYESMESAAQEVLARDLAGRGVDIIIGHHPHVVQNIALIEDTLVVYSLGNFIFDQYFSAPVQEGLMVTLDFWGSQNRLMLDPVTVIDKLSAPRLMTEAERLTFLQALADRSEPALAASIATGEIVW